MQTTRRKVEAGNEFLGRHTPRMRRSSIGLLETRSSALTTELLGLAASGVGDKEGLVVLEEEFLELTLGGLVVVLLIVGDETLGNGLTDGQNLRARTTSTDADAHVEGLEAALSDEKDWLENLQSEGGWLQNVDRLSIDTNISSALGDGGHGSGVLLSSEGLHLLSFLLS